MTKERSYGYECYLDIAEELSGDCTLDDLDESAVAAAQEWAKKNKKRWPPKPRTTGWEVRVWSI